MAFVNRWSIARTLNTQNIAEHSYFVSIYTDQICIMMGYRPEFRAECILVALYHDRDEIFSGDIPGPFKREVVDPTKYHGMNVNLAVSTFKTIAPRFSDQHKDVVKCADLIDEVFFLNNEIRMGNSWVGNFQESSWERLIGAVGNLQGDDERKQKILDTVRKQLAGTDKVMRNSDDLES